MLLHKYSFLPWGLALLMGSSSAGALAQGPAPDTVASVSGSVPNVQGVGDAAVRQFLQTDGLQGASVGILIKDIASGQEVASYQSEACRIPASVTKLVTTAAALEALGDTFRFETRLNYSGFIQDSVLHGNLYIVGGGDPTLESDYFAHEPIFEEMCDAVCQAGIKRIEGQVVGDASLFQRSGANGSWLVEDVGSYYGQTPSALCFHDNLLMLTCVVDSLGKVNVEAILPRTGLLSIDNRLTPGSPLWWRTYGDTYSWYKIIRGNVPSGKKTLVKVETPDPALLMADSMQHRLKFHGISSGGSASTMWASERAPLDNVLYSHFSSPLRDIATQTNNHSVNLFAENLFLYTAIRNRATDIVGYDYAAVAMSRFWRQRGIETDHVHQVDGSGLSMKNSISPRYLTNILCYMQQSSAQGAAFASSLPVAGKSGTVKSFMKNTLLQGKAMLKSGSMERVQNFAGYVLWNNRMYAVTFMVNNFDCPRAKLRLAMSDMLNNAFRAVGGDDAVVKKPVKVRRKAAAKK